MSLAEEARQVRERIAARLRELEPLAREYEELQRLAAEMGIEGGEADAARPRSPARQRTRPRRRAARGSSEAEGFSATGELPERVLEAVRSEPGKTVGEYAAILGVAPTALYRPVRTLTDSRAIVKRARQLFPE
jgi:hypothetical protein